MPSDKKNNEEKNNYSGLIATIAVILLMAARAIPIAALIIAYYLYGPCAKTMGGVGAFFTAIIMGFILSIAGMVVIAALAGM